MGVEAYTVAEYAKMRSATELIKNSKPWYEYPDYLKSGVEMAKWTFNAILYKLGLTGCYRVMDSNLASIPIYVINPGYKYIPKEVLGETHYGEKNIIFLEPPTKVSSITLESLGIIGEEPITWAYAFITMHELVHAYFMRPQHGSYQFDRVYLTLMQILKEDQDVVIFLKNVYEIAIYHPDWLIDTEELLIPVDLILSPSTVASLELNKYIYVEVANGYADVISEDLVDVKKKGGNVFKMTAKKEDKKLELIMNWVPP